MKLNPILSYETNIVKNNLKRDSILGLLSSKNVYRAVNYIHDFAQKEFFNAEKMNSVVSYETLIVKNNLKVRSLFGLLSAKEAYKAVDYIHSVAQEEILKAESAKRYFESKKTDNSIKSFVKKNNAEKNAVKNQTSKPDVSELNMNKQEDYCYNTVTDTNIATMSVLS